MATNFTTGGSTAPKYVTTGDFNDDGKLDLVTANLLGNDVSILIGNGNGTFANPTFFSMGTGPFWVAAGTSTAMASKTSLRLTLPPTTCPCAWAQAQAHSARSLTSP